MLRHALTGVLLTVALAAPALAAEGQASLFAGGIGNFFITLIIFGAVVYILGTQAWPPLLKLLDEREHAIRGSLEEARKEREEAEKLLSDYKEQIAKAREEATAIVEEGRRDAAAVRSRMQEEAREESAEMIERAKREIGLATDAAKTEIYEQASQLAVQVAGAIVRKELSADDHKQLVSEALERMKQQANLN